MTDEEWERAFRSIAETAGVDSMLPEGWGSRAARARHVARVFASQLDATDEGDPLRKALARSYARAFSLFIDAGKRSDRER
ncbi:hypothetical protein [Sandaracinus amylolyticus]|uniref:hypothetical protein n=1 Tax=Sandaracinus amylolyticus TaxID=927083 RepID=UPI001F15C0B5|nr:hypothetical protein [Sandaracinus amylolyticus]UJR83632.1 Hypothetical protein I5071_57000 [Sandaracinus amylolyticus]